MQLEESRSHAYLKIPRDLLELEKSLNASPSITVHIQVSSIKWAFTDVETEWIENK